MDYLINVSKGKKAFANYNLDRIDAAFIPICNDCLFEMKDGHFVCEDCKVNLCSLHLEIHTKKNKCHKIIELILKK